MRVINKKPNGRAEFDAYIQASAIRIRIIKDIKDGRAMIIFQSKDFDTKLMMTNKQMVGLGLVLNDYISFAGQKIIDGVEDA